MGAIRVVTDSACDLSPFWVEERGIEVVPLSIRFGDDEYVDGVELSVKEFWDRVVTGAAVPSTAAPAPGAFQTVFEDAASAGADGVICLTLSSALSATYQAAILAAEAVSNTIPVRVIDTATVTAGLGLLVLEAADLVDSGLTLDEIAAKITEAKARTKVFGVVGSLDHLKRGGRIGGASHLLGSVLSIKPIVEVRDGRVEVESKQRTRSKAVTYLAGKAREAGPLKRLALANGAAADIQDVVAQLVDVDVAEDLFVTDLGPVVGSHAGPATIGICFITAEK